MKRISVMAIIIMALFCIERISAQTLAFPGAEGFGKYAVGGRYGSVYHVTNLNDSGTGSLRDAVGTSNRIVVFDVAGVIQLNSRLVFESNLYVAGQTAPGEGIIVYGDGVSFSGASNTIVRYMRFRMGASGTSGADAAGVANGTNMIFDHLSVSWGRDETFSISPDNKGDLGNITIQNSIISQGLLTHSAGGLVQADNITLYRNLYADNATRNAKVKGKNQYVNNIVYNWKNAAYIMGGGSSTDAYCNVENSLFIKGPAAGTMPFSGGNDKFHIYANGNYYDENRDGLLNPYLIPASEYSGITTFQTEPYDYPELPTLPAGVLIDSLVQTIGASLPYRDWADYYVLDELLSYGTDGGLISTEAQLSIGAPTAWNVWAGISRIDTDGDGMPDVWESSNGTNPAVNDAMTIAANGYANIENYINSIESVDRQEYLRAPIGFSLEKSTSSSLTLSWSDYTEEEDGFIIEMLNESVYEPVDTLEAGVELYQKNNLTPAASYTFRIRAYKGEDKYSAYSADLTVKTQPLEVDEIDPDNYMPDYTWAEGADIWDFSSLCWNNRTSAFVDSSSVLFMPLQTDTVLLNTTAQIAAMLVKDDGDLYLGGSGVLAGNGSVNKAGNGCFKMALINNTYTGATVLSGGTFEFSKLADGGKTSSIGASYEFAQNWIWKGGVWKYTGGNASTNRAAKIYEDTEFNISNSAATITLNGSLEGTGGLILNGEGQLSPTTPFLYTGATTLKGGTLYVDGSGASTMISESGTIGSSSKLILAGGTLKTKGENSSYESYSFPIEIKEETYSYISVHRNCSIKSTVSGSGTVELVIPYVREYITGDWTDFTGTLVANGTGTDSDGSQLLLLNGGFPNAVVQTKGNTRIVCWSTNGTYYLGGLSGITGTCLSASSKQTTGAQMNWIVGGAGTDETFRGVIDNRCSNGNYQATTSIVKEGDGYWRLTGNNSYKGTTGIKEGKLIVNGTHTGTGAVTVYDGGALAGTGTLNAAVTIESGGMITPGDTIVNNLSLKLKAGLTMKAGAMLEIPIVKTSPFVRKSNKLAVTGSLLLDGELNFQIDTLYHLVAGDYFDILDLTNTTSISGAFDNIVPEVPRAGLKWDVSQLNTTGRIYVRNENYVAIDNLKTPDIRIYPTQVRDVLHIELPTSTAMMVGVYNSMGKQMCYGLLTADTEWNVSSWPNGIYILRLKDEDNHAMIKKIMKY